ncbi:MAG TPA: YciI family protein [Opitutus sp.]|nr:YciI family protein [Opitutus sp.]
MSRDATPNLPYILFFRNSGPDTFKHLSPEQRQQLVTRWNEWYDDLLAHGKATDGQPLEEETRLITGAGGQRIVDGPFPETKEAIGGYVLLQVSGLDEATEIAQRHPGLEHGLKVELRPMVNHCHLGVNVGRRPSTETANAR